MSYEKFDRRYSLVIGRLSTSIIQSVPTSIARIGSTTVPRYLAATKLINNSLGDITKGVKVDYRTTPDEFIDIRDLNMRAKIVYKKSGSKGGNQFSTISLDNLAEDTKNRIRENDFIFLRAGYRRDIGGDDVPYEDLPLILAAQITTVETKRDSNSATVTTSLVCGDNILPKKSIKISKSWAPSSSKGTVLKDMLDLAQANFVPLGKVQAEVDGFMSPLNEIYPHGYSVAGNLFEEIQNLCDSVDFRFYTVLGKIYVEPKGAVKTFEAVQIVPQALKEPLQRYSDNSSKPQGGKGESTGITAKMFLDGRILTNMVLDVTGQGDDWDGLYPISSISHELDFEGDNWDTTIKTTRL